VTDVAPQVPLADVLVDEELIAAVTETLQSGWWSMGPRVAEFESEFADAISADHVFAVANGTAALHLALLALDLGPGDEVVLTSLNFVAAANVVSLVGATPVFCDIASASDLNVSLDDLKAAMTANTKAIIALHYGGFPCDIEQIVEFAADAGIAVVEDAAHAPGGRVDGRACGTFGDVGCFSFFSNKNMPLGEGGMVVVRDPRLAEKLRLLRSHGMTTLTWDRHRGHADSYDVLLPGLNYRLDEIRAALGLVQLRRLVAENTRRGAVLQAYRQALEGVGGLAFPFAERGPNELPAYHLAVMLLPTAVDRSVFRASLRERGVQTSVHYPPIHQFTAYRDAGRRRPLPQTEAVAGRIVTLPLFGSMTPAQTSQVIQAVNDVVLTAVNANGSEGS
jgi:dTDP-4-amino-4,6-dideoxygalactose transaminase